MRNLLLALMLLGNVAVIAHAQDLLTTGALVTQGYEVKAAYGIPSYRGAAVLYLQEGASLYFCLIGAPRGGIPQAGDVARAGCNPI